MSVETSFSTSDHPCFSREARHHLGRVHLPVAPACNISCNYCSRLFDCPNEGRPGVTSRLLGPDEALAYLEQAMAMGPISVAGIAGPGDPLANPGPTFRTLRMVKERHPHLLICLSTNGLAAVDFMEEITGCATHVTLTVNAIDESIGARIYRRVTMGGAAFRGIEAAALLLKRQLTAIRALKEAGITVKVNSIVIPGINDGHIVDIARLMGRLRVDMFNTMPLLPVQGTPFGVIPEPGRAQMRMLRRVAAAHLPQMTHCARCRADAAGLLAEKAPVRKACV